MKHKPQWQLLPWLSARQDCKDKRYIQVGNSIMLDDGFNQLHDGAKWLYFSMCMESGGQQKFQFPLSAAKKYGIQERSFRRYISELVDFGCIEVVASGKSARQPTDYQFCSNWKKSL